MQWNKHYRDVPEGAHAFLGASKYSWLNYDDDKVIAAYNNYLATMRGTRLHALAKELIDVGQKLPKSEKTLNMVHHKEPRVGASAATGNSDSYRSHTPSPFSLPLPTST